MFQQYLNCLGVSIFCCPIKRTITVVCDDPAGGWSGRHVAGAAGRCGEHDQREQGKQTGKFQGADGLVVHLSWRRRFGMICAEPGRRCDGLVLEFHRNRELYEFGDCDTNHFALGGGGVLVAGDGATACSVASASGLGGGTVAGGGALRSRDKLSMHRLASKAS